MNLQTRVISLGFVACIFFGIAGGMVTGSLKLGIAGLAFCAGTWCLCLVACFLDGGE